MAVFFHNSVRKIGGFPAAATAGSVIYDIHALEQQGIDIYLGHISCFTFTVCDIDDHIHHAHMTQHRALLSVNTNIQRFSPDECLEISANAANAVLRPSQVKAPVHRKAVEVANR